MNRGLRQLNIQYGCRDAPTEEKRKQDDATLQIMSIHDDLAKGVPVSHGDASIDYGPDILAVRNRGEEMGVL